MKTNIATLVFNECFKNGPALSIQKNRSALTISEISPRRQSAQDIAKNTGTEQKMEHIKLSLACI